MFFNCPACGFLVAMDKDGLPLPRCPNCAFRIRAEPRPQSVPDASSARDARSGIAIKADGEARTPEATPEERAATQPDADPRRLPVPQTRPARTRDAMRDATAAAAADAGRVIPLPAPAGTALVVVPTGPASATRDATAAPVPSTPSTPPTPPPVADTPARNESHAASAMTVADVIAAIESTRPGTRRRETPPPSPPAPRLQARDQVPASEGEDAGLAADAAPAERATGAEAVQSARLVLAGTPDAAVVDDAATKAPGTMHAAGKIADNESHEGTLTTAMAANAARADAVPSFARVATPPNPRDRRHGRLHGAALVALSLLLGLQLLMAQRAQLAADAGWRPVVAGACAVLRCTLPAWREPSAFTMLDRNVRERPGRAGVLRVSATFRNDARWPQPWPLLHLTLSDVDGAPVAERDFTPREYLGDAPTQAGPGSGQSTSVAFDVIAPSKPAVAFTFDFR